MFGIYTLGGLKASADFYCFSIVLRDSAGATTDRACNFQCVSMVLRDSAGAITDRVLRKT